jgi:lactoylglutathione lyase
VTGPLTVEEFFPILVSPDLPGLLRFWVEGLGARQTYQFPEEGAPVFVGLDLAGQHLGLGHAPEVDGHGPVSLWLYVPDCDAAVARLLELGAELVSAAADQPWGERTATVRDPSGTALVLGQRGLPG